MTDFDRYISEFPSVAQAICRALRETIESVAPNVACQVFRMGRVIYFRMSARDEDILCSVIPKLRRKAVSLGFQAADELADPGNLFRPAARHEASRARFVDVSSVEVARSDAIRDLVRASYDRYLRRVSPRTPSRQRGL